MDYGPTSSPRPIATLRGASAVGTERAARGNGPGGRHTSAQPRCRVGAGTAHEVPPTQLPGPDLGQLSTGRPSTVARSTRRLEYPVSLSYHPSTLTRLPFAMVSFESKMHEAEEPTMSVDTRSSSEYSSRPASRPTSAAAR